MLDPSRARGFGFRLWQVLQQAVPVALRTQQAFFGSLGRQQAAQFAAMPDDLHQLDGGALPCAPMATTATNEPA